MHTEGRLECSALSDRTLVIPKGVGSEGVPRFAAIAVVMSRLDGEDNARRLVAAWNAFEGVATDDIPRMGVAVREARLVQEDVV